MNLIETPDRIRFGQIAVAHDSSAATTFVVLPDQCILASKRPHPFIYNALNICLGDKPYMGRTIGIADSKSAKKVLEDYETWVCKGSKLTPEVLAKTKKLKLSYKGEKQVVDFWRKVLLVGRVWKNIKLPDIGMVSAFSFWASSDRLSNANIEFLIKSFSIKGPVYIETLDAAQPVLYQSLSKGLDPVMRKSTIAPHLSQDQIYDIVVKAHTSPWTLTDLEKEVAAEWYGKGAAVPGTNGGYTTKAEFNFRNTIGDSVMPIRFSFLKLFERG